MSVGARVEDAIEGESARLLSGIDVSNETMSDIRRLCSIPLPKISRIHMFDTTVNTIERDSGLVLLREDMSSKGLVVVPKDANCVINFGGFGGVEVDTAARREEAVKRNFVNWFDGGDWSSINFDDSLRDDGKDLGPGDFVEEVDDRFDAKGACDGPVGAIGEAGLPCADVAAGFRDTSLRDKFSTGAS